MIWKIFICSGFEYTQTGFVFHPHLILNGNAGKSGKKCDKLHQCNCVKFKYKSKYALYNTLHCHGLQDYVEKSKLIFAVLLKKCFWINFKGKRTTES